MFRRSKEPEAAPDNPADDATAPGAKSAGSAPKGRPTPTRREAEAAAKLRATGGSLSPKQSRKQRAAQVREGMRTGDERFLLERDKGPVRRFIRDYVDTRFTITELMLPILMITWAMTFSRSPALMRASTGIVFGCLLVVIYDFVMLRIRIRREVAQRFPDASMKGNVHYAAIRLLQVRPLRRPKPQVKIGQALPDVYR
ncbi:MAG: DUF3043 domain-containing protein [Nocardioides sp.]